MPEKHDPRTAGRRVARVGPMAIDQVEHRLRTRGETEIVDITEYAATLVEERNVESGQLLAFVRGSTAAITTMEFEPGGIADLRDMLERLIPAAGDYAHNRLNHDSNSHAHQRASIIGP